jgi:DNA-directed RNA polymerase specialized sigma24 family protein
MSQPRVVWCPTAKPLHNSPRFDTHQFYERGHFLNEDSDLSYSDLKHMRIGRVADLRKGRRLEVPTWATSDALLRVVIVRYLENRFMLNRRQGTLQERLDICRAAAKRHAAAKKKHLEEHIQQFRACAQNRFAELSERNYEQLFLETLAGKGSTARLNALEKQVRTLDGDLFVTESAAALTAAILYQYFRLGYPSPTIAESLSLTPCQVRQILFRARRVARKEEKTSPRKRVRLDRAKVEEILRLSASGLSWEEVAAKFGVVRNTVKSIVGRSPARQAMAS